jgi:polysaccharide biosynthesis/export protein
MTFLKITTLCIVFVASVAEVLISSSTQVVESERAKNQPAASPDAAKPGTPPPITQRADYVVEPPDLIDVEIEEAAPGRPIKGERLVRPDGKISLSFYGDVYVAGLTVPEIKTKIISHMQKFLFDETLGLVVPEDTVDLFLYPATKRIDPKDSKAVRVRLTQCNSKFFYVAGEVLSPGRFPVTGTQTILDAIALAGGLSPLADRENVVLYRAGVQGTPQSMTVDLDQITHGARPLGDDHLKSGDRLVIRRRAGNRAAADNGGPKTSQVPSRPRRGIDPAAPALSIERREQGEVGTEDPSMRRLEKRLADLEYKLDLIIERLKKPVGRPEPGKVLGPGTSDNQISGSP